MKNQDSSNSLNIASEVFDGSNNETNSSPKFDSTSKAEIGEERPSSKISQESKTIKKFPFKKKKKYCLITDELREKLIDAVENKNEKIVHAAKKLKINYSSAKSIYQIFKREGRSIKKTFKKRSQELTVSNQFQELSKVNSGLDISKIQASTLTQHMESTFSCQERAEIQKDPLQIIKERLVQSKLNSLKVSEPLSYDIQSLSKSVVSQHILSPYISENMFHQNLNRTQQLTNKLFQNFQNNNFFPVNTLNEKNNETFAFENSINKSSVQIKPQYPQLVFYNQQQNTFPNNMNNIYYQSSPMQTLSFVQNSPNQNFLKLTNVPQLTTMSTQMIPQHINSYSLHNQQITAGQQYTQHINGTMNPNLVMKEKVFPSDSTVWNQQLISQFLPQQNKQADKTKICDS